VPDSQPAADAAGAKPTGSQTDDFSYAKRLSQPEAPAEPLKAPTTAATPAGGTISTDLPQPPPDAPDDSPAAGRAEATATGPFTVQVAAVKKRSDADVVVKRLKAKGYEARVVAPEAGDRTGVFRVKVGTYKTRHDADAVARKIESEGQYKPWVTR
jgi:cell division septation protein DedD